ncbi:pyridoxal phosphate-dependent transferase [Podospora australis]|uniref:Glutamate decarboxylase n=1 Tax=Podospora australis TaxID=1536484 RepID=A0AAN6WPT9_9PEZI|nr:pyridoxal phosphate-dependent transferase [Podospora australis]
MPSETASRLIENELLNDGDPARNLGTFVTTRMPPTPESLILQTLPKNIANNESYPATTDIQRKCVDMVAHLFHVPSSFSSPEQDATGTTTAGSSEAILLAVLALKLRWLSRRSSSSPTEQPNLILSSAAHICWAKACLYFSILPRYVPLIPPNLTLSPEAAISLVDSNTIGIVTILGTTHTGEYEPTFSLNSLLVSSKLDIPIHVDAASGGFVAPFLTPSLVWDFRLEKVVSINVSGHKYGLVYAGLGFIIWRSPEYLPKEMVMKMNYLGNPHQKTVTLNFSRGASHVVAQYYNLLSLGFDGYKNVMTDLTKIADLLADRIEDMGGFLVLSKRNGEGLPLVAFRLDDSITTRRFNEFDVAQELTRQGGWMVPAYTLAPNAEMINVLRVVVRQDFGVEQCSEFVEDLRMVMKRLNDSSFGSDKGIF